MPADFRSSSLLCTIAWLTLRLRLRAPDQVTGEDSNPGSSMYGWIHFEPACTGSLFVCTCLCSLCPFCSSVNRWYYIPMLWGQ